MDPRVLPEHDGWPAAPAKNEDGISYLRRLKGGSGAASSSAAIKNEAQPTQQCGDWKDRRQSPRLRCSGSAEFRTRGSAVHMWGTLNRHQPAWMLRGNEQYVSRGHACRVGA